MKKIILGMVSVLSILACSKEAQKTETTVTSVELNKTTLELIAGESETLVATVKPSDVTDKTVTWSTSNASIATVENGKVTAIKEGEATITAAAGGKAATCTVTVTQPQPNAVDLGLSVKWASYNVGATKPEEYGDYYAWGETETYYSSLNPLKWKEGKTGYNWDSYKWSDGQNVTKYCEADEKTVLEPTDDVVHVQLGGKWRMPTIAEWRELSDKCTWSWTTQNGINGYLVVASNGNSIFLPASGWRNGMGHDGLGVHGSYWSSSISSIRWSNALSMSFANSARGAGSSCDRIQGQPVRPVSE